MKNNRPCVRALLALVFAALPLGAQPVGTEFHVNSVTTVSQSHPKVARRYGADGFLVVWDGGGFGATVTDIYASSFDPQAVKQVPDFEVNGYTLGFQTYPAVAGEYDGTFTVVWESMGEYESNYGIYGRRFDAGGGSLGGDLLVSTYTSGLQRHPSIAPTSAPTRVRSVFEGVGPGAPAGIFQSSDTFAAQSLVNVYTAGAQHSPSISGNIALLAGAPDYLIVWSGNGADDFDGGIFAHLFDQAGGSVGTDFRVNATATGSQTFPAVASDPFALGHVVVWVAQATSGTDIHAQRLAANGSPRGAEFRVNTYTTGSQGQPQVAVDDLGNFVVVWTNYVYGVGGDGNVHAQAYSAPGAPAGTEFRLNTYTTNNQRHASVAATGGGSGQFVVVWSSFGQEGTDTGEGVFGRLFVVPFPNGDANGDGVVTVSDVFYLINYLFAGGVAPIGSGDVNNDQLVNTNDVFYLINYLYSGGPPPA